MTRIRIRGLVGLARAVRQELSRPGDGEARQRLRSAAASAVRIVDDLLAGRSGSLDALTPPSRRAYEFLRTLTLPRAARRPAEAPPAPRSVRFPGLNRFITGVVRRLAEDPSPEQLDHIRQSIRSAGEGLERVLRENRFEGRHLRDDAAELRGWLGYFGDADHLGAYLRAVERARRAFEGPCRESRDYRLPVRVQFQPVRVLYRVRAMVDHTLVQLPTPMIALDQAAMNVLAQAALGAGRSATLTSTGELFGEGYHRVLRQLRALGGGAETSRGAHHDLSAAFERVNRRYFCGSMGRPHLGWSRRLARRKFAHYDHAQDAISLSPALDRRTVPAYVIDYIVYHELLHRKHGLRWRNGRRAVHTPAFRREERRFHRFADAHAFLQRLAREA